MSDFNAFPLPPDDQLPVRPQDEIDRRDCLRRLAQLGLAGALGSTLGCIPLLVEDGSVGFVDTRQWPSLPVASDPMISGAVEVASPNRNDHRTRTPVGPRAESLSAWVPTQRWTPPILDRSRWSTAAPISRRLKRLGRIDRITLHHDGMPNANWSIGVADVVRDLRKIQRGHVKNMKAGDIGYHFVIDREGRIWEGRSLQYQGAHVRGKNPNNLGIVMLGNYQKQMPRSQTLHTLDRLVRACMARWRVPVARVRTHRELAATVCPGKNLQPRIDALRRGW